jgi:hypothetical protein
MGVIGRLIKGLGGRGDVYELMIFAAASECKASVQVGVENSSQRKQERHHPPAGGLK